MNYGPQSMTRMERFERMVERVPFSACWYWVGSLGWGGYGSFWSGKRRMVATRWIYEQTYGPIPDGADLDHFVCEERLCVNPDHVRPASRRENILRGNSRAATFAARTHCKNGHPFDAGNTYWDNKRRRCRECRRAEIRRRRKEKPETFRRYDKDKYRKRMERNAFAM